MFIAEKIRRKLADLEEIDSEEGEVVEQLRAVLRETREDLLTSDMFGVLKYLPRVPYLEAVLRAIVDRNPHAESFRQCVCELGPHVESLNFRFWPSYPTPAGLPGLSTEPDVEVSGTNILIFFEAKLHSGFGEGQVERELAVGLEQSRSREFFLVLVTRSTLPPRMSFQGCRLSIRDYPSNVGGSSQMSKDVGEQLRANPNRVLWISWHAILSALDAAHKRHPSKDGVCHDETRRAGDIIGDLKQLMLMRGIQPFNGFDDIVKPSATDMHSLPTILPWVSATQKLFFTGFTFGTLPKLAEVIPLPKGKSLFFPQLVHSRETTVGFSAIVANSELTSDRVALLSWISGKDSPSTTMNVTTIVKNGVPTKNSLILFPWRKK